MSMPTRPGSSAKTDPAHAPTKTQIAAPENHVTKARATPKKPNCNDVSLSRLVWSVLLVGVLLAVVQVLVGAAGGSNRVGAAAASISPEPAPGAAPEPS
jgi:hypothetical protein